MSVNSSISHPRLTRGSYTSYFTLQISNTILLFTLEKFSKRDTHAAARRHCAPEYRILARSCVTEESGERIAYLSRPS